ncbi:tRNA lysidine(34) synthetase TilS [Tardiphaga sp.]|uniref:tRNA lysidine(34) synthetase TilS n=1 Tax=Tardiphaga sp. TaxID=1926292 RepID=UPI0026102019|nr:tRNA lysidine(34) synthetase TilS [Tardiphaga sp.]MDB5615839.1 tRNA lysidine(34) synthetase TilS [Tardiphaga sp.]
MSDDDHSPIAVAEAKRLFADWRSAAALILAVSGGPDSMALLWLAARWRRALKRGPDLIAVTIDHGLRPEAAREARDVKKLAAALDLPHRTLRWTGDKPTNGLPAAARAARYRLLAKAARAHKASHILTAHTQDDQAETLLMRMARGSGLAGLAAMARQTPREGVLLARPFLDIPKSRLIATLARARVGFAEDPTNKDLHFTRPRLRALMPQLKAEGFDPGNLARLAARLARANVALELMVDGAESFVELKRVAARPGIDTAVFSGLAEEVRLRLLLRLIDRVGYEGPAGLGQAEALLAAIDRAVQADGKGIRLKQTLAGALITLSHDRLRIDPAPPRRRRD